MPESGSALRLVLVERLGMDETSIPLALASSRIYTVSWLQCRYG